MTDIADRLLERLTATGRGHNFPNVRPRDAATMIIIDRSSAVPKVLLGRRHLGHKFMPGKFVFPGGRVEPLDRRMRSAGALDPRVEARLLDQTRRPSPDKARAFALAAVRETFEETGILIGLHRKEAVFSPGGPWDAFAQAGIIPDLGAVHFVARAVTPPRLLKRFDTRFFAVDASAIAARHDGVVGPDTELTELTWHPLAEAPRLEMAGITTAVLEELAARIADGFSHDLPVPYYRMLSRRRSRVLL
jgi:8-oxo-dGTP pyrophosphatase MutT (NUDIX family)